MICGRRGIYPFVGVSGFINGLSCLDCLSVCYREGMKKRTIKPHTAAAGQMRRAIRASPSPFARFREKLLAAADELEADFRREGETLMSVSSMTRTVEATRAFAFQLPAYSEPPLIVPDRKVAHWPEREAHRPRKPPLAAGEARLVLWSGDGTLLRQTDLATHFGISSQALDARHRKGEFSSILVRGKRYVPAAFRDLEMANIRTVSGELAGLSDSVQILFWLTPQDLLDGRTAAQAIQTGEVEQARRAAQGWAEVRGLRRGQPLGG